jgi:hypothetical protein
MLRTRQIVLDNLTALYNGKTEKKNRENDVHCRTTSIELKRWKRDKQKNNWIEIYLLA